MEPKFNIDRPKLTDEEINKHKNFEKLVKQFKEQSIQKAKHDKSWWKSKKVRYSAIIAGATVICTVTYLSLFNNKTETKNTHDKITTSTQAQKQEETQKPRSVNFIAPPSSKLNIPYSSYKVNNAKGGELTHPSSTTIKIPKKAFVDKQGHEIVGDVTIEYREFQNKAEIIAGGIPMAYDSAGKSYQLESAGMFDIRGTQNGEPVFIRENLKIELASSNAEDRFNQYYLDTTERNWKYLKRDKMKVDFHPAYTNEDQRKEKPEIVKANRKLSVLKEEINVIIPKKIDSVGVVYQKKTGALPKSKEPIKPKKASGKQTFNIDADPKDFPELSALGNFVFELGAENTHYTPEMNEVTWNDIRVSEGPQKGVNYLLTLKQGARTVKLVVYPVLSGNELNKAMDRYEEQLQNYKAIAEKRSQQEKKLMDELKSKQAAYYAEIEKKKAEFEKEKVRLMSIAKSEQQNELVNAYDKLDNKTRAVRIFEVSNFGIYNSDCPHPPGERRSVEPAYTTNDGKKFSPTLVYLIDHRKNLVYTLNRSDDRFLTFNSEHENSLVLFRKDQFWVCGKEDFKKAVEENAGKFTVKEIPESENNIAGLRKAMEL